MSAMAAREARSGTYAVYLLSLAAAEDTEDQDLLTGRSPKSLNHKNVFWEESVKNV